MIQFNRNYELRIGDAESGEGVLIKDLQIKFTIKKVVNNNKKTDECSVDIVNLSDEHLALIQVEYPVLALSCGYDGNLVEIFRGDITTEETQKRGTDRVTRITASPRYTDLNHILMSELIPDGGTVEDGIEKIRKQTSIAKGVYKGEQLSQIITYGYPLVGTPRQMLDQVCNAYKLDWKIEGDALYINAVDTVDTEIKNLAPVISAKTGLLDAPYQFKGSEGQSKDDPAKRKGLRFKALINPTVVPGSLVKVVHKDTDSFYRVDEVTYKGDYRGNSWEMECVCYTRIKEGT